MYLCHVSLIMHVSVSQLKLTARDERGSESSRYMRVIVIQVVIPVFPQYDEVPRVTSLCCLLQCITVSLVMRPYPICSNVENCTFESQIDDLCVIIALSRSKLESVGM